MKRPYPILSVSKKKPLELSIYARHIDIEKREDIAEEFFSPLSFIGAKGSYGSRGKSPAETKVPNKAQKEFVGLLGPMKSHMFEALIVRTRQRHLMSGLGEDKGDPLGLFNFRMKSCLRSNRGAQDIFST